jgi:uncharacterized protein (TIGR03083 family)
MMTVAVDRGKTRAAIQEVAAQFAELIRGSDPNTPIPGAEWTVGEAASHVAFANRAFVEIAGGGIVVHGDGTRQGLAAANARKLAELPERDCARLSDAIVEWADAFVAATTSRSPAQRVVTPMGEMDLDAASSYVLMHMLQHAHPIARAIRRPSPLRREHVALILPFITLVMPKVLRPDKVKDLTANFVLHLRGGPSFSVSFDKGVATVAATPPGRVDCHISADPVTLLLVAARLKSQWAGIATGKLVTWGTKPWLALRFVGFFDVP